MYRSQDVKFLENNFYDNLSEDEQTEILNENTQPSDTPVQSNIPQYFFGFRSDKTGCDNFTDDFIEKGVEEDEIEVLNPIRPYHNTRTPVRYGECATLAEVESEPKAYKQTLKNTMSEEISALTNHETWDLVDFPDG